MNNNKKRKTMFYVLTYDIASPKRLPKTLKVCRKYLYWVQKSVFEGELTNRQFNMLKAELKRSIKKDEDFVLFYAIRNREVVDRGFLGVEKNEISNFI